MIPFAAEIQLDACASLIVPPLNAASNNACRIVEASVSRLAVSVWIWVSMVV